MKLRRALLTLLAVASACTAATPGFVVNSAVGGSGAMASSGRFIVLPGLPGVDTSDARFLEVRGYVARAMQSGGARPAASIDEADVAVLVRYGIGAQPPSTIVRRAFAPLERAVAPPSLVGQAGLPDSSTFQPAAGDVGSTVDFDQVVSGSAEPTYRRWLALEGVNAASFRRDGTGVALWTKTVASVGRSDDLGRMMPYLIVSLAPYIGRKTRREILVSVDQHDRRVKALREP